MHYISTATLAQDTSISYPGHCVFSPLPVALLEFPLPGPPLPITVRLRFLELPLELKPLVFYHD